MTTFRVLTLNNISERGLSRFPPDRYEVAANVGDPDAIMLRSADLHAMVIPASVKAIGRAGAGTNNVPVAEMSKRGIPVFNAPGANANAVKELVIAGLFLSARNICEAWGYVRGLQGDDQALELAVEKGKKQFVGHELPGRVLGVIGLGAIGVEVANAAHRLGHARGGIRSGPDHPPRPATVVRRRAHAVAGGPVLPGRHGDGARSAGRRHEEAGQRCATPAHAPGRHRPEFLARRHRRRPGADGGARRRHAGALRLRLSDQRHQGPSRGRRPAAPGRVHRGSGGELRHHGGRHASRLVSSTATSGTR